MKATALINLPIPFAVPNIPNCLSFRFIEDLISLDTEDNKPEEALIAN